MYATTIVNGQKKPRPDKFTGQGHVEMKSYQVWKTRGVTTLEVASIIVATAMLIKSIPNAYAIIKQTSVKASFSLNSSSNFRQGHRVAPQWPLFNT